MMEILTVYLSLYFELFRWIAFFVALWFVGSVIVLRARGETDKMKEFASKWRRVAAIVFIVPALVVTPWWLFMVLLGLMIQK